MNIGDRLGRNHPVVKGDLSGAKEFVMPEPSRDGVLSRAEVFRASTAMTDEELVVSIKGGNNDAAEILLRRYAPILLSIARRGAKRNAMEIDECNLLARLGVFKAARICKTGLPFRPYAMRFAVGEIREEARNASRSRGWRRVTRMLETRDRTGLTRKKVSKSVRFAVVLSDNIPTDDGGSLAYTDLVASNENISEQIGEIIAAEQAAEQRISAWQLVKDGNVLAAFLKALPPFAADEALRVMRGMTIEESMAETGFKKTKISKARAEIDRYSEEWGIA